MFLFSFKLRFTKVKAIKILGKINEIINESRECILDHTFNDKAHGILLGSIIFCMQKQQQRKILKNI